MTTPLVARAPFSFEQTIAFVRRFPPCQGDHVITDDSITSAVSIGGRAVAFTIRGRGDSLVIEGPPEVVPHAAHFVGADDELAPFYAAAEGDAPVEALIARLHGLHHVRFPTLGEIAVYCVMMQRAPIAIAALLKRRFLARFGLPVDAGGHTLRAMPALDALAELDGRAIAEAIGNARKGPQIAAVVRGVARLGERFLRTAPYAEARDALLAIPYVGPFSAAAILLRGLGRMDELPAVMPGLADEARAMYGDAYDEIALARRYGRHVGYWAYYVKTGVDRLLVETRARPRRPPRARPTRRAARRRPAR